MPESARCPWCNRTIPLEDGFFIPHREGDGGVDQFGMCEYAGMFRVEDYQYE